MNKHSILNFTCHINKPVYTSSCSRVSWLVEGCVLCQIIKKIALPGWLVSSFRSWSLEVPQLKKSWGAQRFHCFKHNKRNSPGPGRRVKGTMCGFFQVGRTDPGAPPLSHNDSQSPELQFRTCHSISMESPEHSSAGVSRIQLIIPREGKGLGVTPREPWEGPDTAPAMEAICIYSLEYNESPLLSLLWNYHRFDITWN